MTYVRWQDHPPAEFDQDDSAIANITQTDFGGSTPSVAVRFVAPTSGRALITCGGGARGDGSNRVYVAPQVLEDFDDQTEVVVPSSVLNGLIISSNVTSHFHAQRTVMVEGLTPGQRYLARPRVAVSGGSGADVTCRDIVVEPVP